MVNGAPNGSMGVGVEWLYPIKGESNFDANAFVAATANDKILHWQFFDYCLCLRHPCKFQLVRHVACVS